MNLIDVVSHEDMINRIKDLSQAYVLLYKKDSEISDCALKNLKEALTDLKDVQILFADVKTVRDIHTQYNINSVPTLLYFEKGSFTNTFKGCNEASYYRSVFENNIYAAAVEGKAQKRVTVYTTPSCSWCTTLKSHLRKHGIRYTEIDVSTNQSEAENMARKSGQRGVPQTDINGQMIVGFDKDKINRLLEIN